MDSYSKTLKAVYKITHLTEGNVKNMSMNKIVNIVENSYVDIASNYQSDLQHRYFELVVEEYHITKQTVNGNVTLETYIHYEQDHVAVTISFLSDKTDFAEETEMKLQNYFNNEHVEFFVIKVDLLEIDTHSKSFDYVLYSLLSFLGFMALISIGALMFNKKPDSKIDDAQWSIALQCYLDCKSWIFSVT